MDPLAPRRGLTRRDALRGAAGATVLAFGARGLRAEGSRAIARPGARADAVIEIWLAGGPSHLDTFDPKPDAGSDYCGPLRQPAATNVAGMRIGELMPLLAQQADKYALLRGVTHGINGHETAAYAVQTGREATEGGLVHPSFGTVATSFLGSARRTSSLIPPWVMLTSPRGRFSEVGFLGLENKPFVTGGDPRRPRFAVEGIVAEGISDAHQVARRELLGRIDTLGRALAGRPTFAAADRCEEEAYGLILGDAGKVFDLREEPDAVRERYGRTTFGQSCLVARRLVEEGVPCVTIHSGGWDTHKRHFETMRARLPDLDRGLATLLADLDERGLLQRTLVWCTGEFGRTPRVLWEEPWNGGRGHHGACFSMLLAGGGIRGGQVVGASDAHGEQVADRPVHPRDVLAAMYELLGIDPDGPLPNPRALDVRVLPPVDPKAPGGRLTELL